MQCYRQPKDDIIVVSCNSYKVENDILERANQVTMTRDN
jgi:hypothetical protein